MSFLFQELRVYQESLQLSQKIFSLTKKWPSIYRFSLANQLERAALSVSLNIAEGSSRTSKEFQHFLRIAQGSCFECVPLLAISKNLSLITDQEYEQFSDILDHISRMITSFNKTLNHAHSDKR